MFNDIFSIKPWVTHFPVYAHPSPVAPNEPMPPPSGFETKDQEKQS